MRVLVTGATGLLGGALCRLLVSRAELFGWARKIPQGQEQRLDLESVDITHPGMVEMKMARCRPDVVIHAAALSDVDVCERDPGLAMEVNAGGTENVARACEASGAALMAVSTDYVFDGALSRPYREGDAPHPVNLYGRSKLEAEQAALRSAGRSVAVRVSGLFGPGRSNFVSGTAEALQNGRPVQVASDQMNSPTYTADLAEGLCRLIDPVRKGELKGVIHLANSGGASRLEVAWAIAEFLGVKDRDSLVKITTWAGLDRPAPRPANSQLDCSRFARITGCPMRPWKEALQEFLRGSFHAG